MRTTGVLLRFSLGQPRSDCFAIIHREAGDDVSVYVVQQVERRVNIFNCLHLLFGSQQQTKHLQSVYAMNNRYDLRRRRQFISANSGCFERRRSFLW